MPASTSPFCDAVGRKNLVNSAMFYWELSETSDTCIWIFIFCKYWPNYLKQRWGMKWRPPVTQAKNSPSLLSAPCHHLPGTLKQVIAFSHREISRKWSNLQLEAFAAECFPQLLSLPQLSDTLCSIPWAKCNCPGKKSMSVFSCWSS